MCCCWFLVQKVNHLFKETQGVCLWQQNQRSSEPRSVWTLGKSTGRLFKRLNYQEEDVCNARTSSNRSRSRVKRGRVAEQRRRVCVRLLASPAALFGRGALCRRVLLEPVKTPTDAHLMWRGVNMWSFYPAQLKLEPATFSYSGRLANTLATFNKRSACFSFQQLSSNFFSKVQQALSAQCSSCIFYRKCKFSI